MFKTFAESWLFRIRGSASDRGSARPANDNIRADFRPRPSRPLRRRPTLRCQWSTMEGTGELACRWERDAPWRQSVMRPGKLATDGPECGRDGPPSAAHQSRR